MKAPKDQHFLIDDEAVNLIADTVFVKNRRVLEVGPGGGVLTSALLERGAMVTAVEVDKGLIPNLEKKFAAEISSKQLSIIQGDASKVPLPQFDLVVANLPYSISSKITFRLLEIGFESAVLMYQLEFGKRMVAPPGDKEYGRLSVMVQTYADAELIFELPPESFSPPPEVWSVVVKISPRKPPVEILDKNTHEVLVRELFSHRRKMIRKSIRGMKNIFGEDAVKRFIEELSDDVLNKRPEMLSVAEFIELSNILSRLKDG